jgi:transposase
MALTAGGIRPLEQRVQALLALGRAWGLDGFASAGGPRPGPAGSVYGQHHGAGARWRGGPKKSTPQAEALGRSRGGFSTKIQALTDALGNPLDFELTGGQAADITPAEALLPDEPVEAVVADKSYDAEAFVATVNARGAVAVIPPRKHRKQLREYDRHVYKERHLIECFFGKIKHYRRIFSRFEKTARNYMGFLRFVAALVWLR